jgi:hypothetical protein
VPVAEFVHVGGRLRQDQVAVARHGPGVVHEEAVSKPRRSGRGVCWVVTWDCSRRSACSNHAVVGSGRISRCRAMRSRAPPAWTSTPA